MRRWSIDAVAPLTRPCYLLDLAISPLSCYWLPQRTEPVIPPLIPAKDICIPSRGLDSTTPKSHQPFSTGDPRTPRTDLHLRYELASPPLEEIGNKQNYLARAMHDRADGRLADQEQKRERRRLARCLAAFKPWRRGSS